MKQTFSKKPKASEFSHHLVNSRLLTAASPSSQFLTLEPEIPEKGQGEPNLPPVRFWGNPQLSQKVTDPGDPRTFWERNG